MRPDGMRQPWVSDPDFEVPPMSDAEIEAAVKRVAAFMASLRDEKKFSPDQPRDENGRWTSGVPLPPDQSQNLEAFRQNQAAEFERAGTASRVVLKEFAADSATKRGFDPSRIDIIEESDAPVFKVGDKLYAQDGVYNRESGMITITHRKGWTEDKIGPVLAHEITHAKYVSIAQSIQRGDRAIGSFAKFKGPDLKRAGGVTEYSSQYWKVNDRKAVHPFDLKTDKAINETLADVAAIRDAKNRKNPIERYVGRAVPPIWNDLFDEVESQYAKGKESGLFKSANQAR